jgi:serine/threonine protein kinase
MSHDEYAAKAAMFRPLDYVAYLHRSGVCHPDIKPEIIERKILPLLAVNSGHDLFATIK